jgi:hypothetical protein
MGNVKLSLPNGITVEGPAAEVAAIARSYGVGVNDGIHYNSSSRGLIRISEMDTKHIKNALRKMYQAWAASLDTNLSTPEFREVLKNGPATDLTMLGLANELKRRV